MNSRNKQLVAVIVLASLFFVWPNFVHESLHLLALKIQGSNGVIHFDWNYPAHPYTERTAPVAGVFGGLLYLLLPSVVSVVLLSVCYLTMHRASILSHIVLPVYLAFDLIINLLRYSSPTSDFHFLIAFPWLAAALVILTIFFSLALLWIGLLNVCRFHT